MDVRSLSSSESELILLLSSDSSGVSCPPPSSQQNAKSKTKREDEPPFLNRDQANQAVTVFEPSLKPCQMEARKKSRRAQIRNPDPSHARSLMSQPTNSQIEDGLTRKLTNKTEDSSSSQKGLGSKQTFDTMRSEKTSKSSIGSWIKRKVLRLKNPGKRSRSKKPQMPNADLSGGNSASKEKTVPGHILVVDESGSIDTFDKEEMSTLLGSMSVDDIRRVFGSADDSIEVIENARETIIADSFSPGLSELMEETRTKIDFRNRLELYKARSEAYNNDNVHNRVQRLKKEASFMLLSFSMAPSESESTTGNDTDEDTTDDNLAEAIAKEMNFRRLFMGEPESPGISIREVSIPTPKTKDILSPRKVNASQTRPETKVAPAQLSKPVTPLHHLAGFFFGTNENMGSPHPACGGPSASFSP